MTEQQQCPQRCREEALSADAVVVEEGGRWIVSLDAVLASGAVRRQVADEHDDSMCWPYSLSIVGDLLAIADPGRNRVMVWDLA